MNNNKFKVWIEAETWVEGEWDIYNDNTDVTVEFEDNTRWVASFFTYSNINKIIEKNKATGECLNGKYFWSSDMLLVDEISRERIEEVIKHLIDNNEFCYIFNRCSD
jgi:hypothetical protein